MHQSGLLMWWFARMKTAGVLWALKDLLRSRCCVQAQVSAGQTSSTTPRSSLEMRGIVPTSLMRTERESRTCRMRIKHKRQTSSRKLHFQTCVGKTPQVHALLAFGQLQKSQTDALLFGVLKRVCVLHQSCWGSQFLHSNTVCHIIS